MPTDARRQPHTPIGRRRAELIAAGRLDPRRRDNLEAPQPLPSLADGEPTLSELLQAMRDQERT